MIAEALVIGIIVAEIVLPLAIAFNLGRSFERRAQRRALTRGAERLLAASDAFAGDPRPAEQGELVPLRLSSDVIRPGRGGFPRTRRRRLG